MSIQLEAVGSSRRSRLHRHGYTQDRLLGSLMDAASRQRFSRDEAARETYHVPASNTAAGLALFEEVGDAA